MVLLIVTSILFLDQLSKFIISKAIPVNQSVAVIDGFFHLTLIHNRGAAFGILKNRVPFFVFTASLALVLIYYSLRDGKRKTLVNRLSLALISAGAIGNLIDRLLFGYVIDFLDFRIWPVFNVADSAITIGAVLLGWTILTKRGNDTAPPPAQK